jgi:hypothetical protein
MPVRYDIAAGLAQPQQSYSPMNMLAQMQAMDYREQQNALAQAQLAEYQRKAQAEQARAGLFAKPGFNPLSQQGLLDIARADPEYFRQFISPYASYTSGLASARESGKRTQLAEREFEEIKKPRAQLEGKKLGLETDKEARLLLDAARKLDISTLDLGIKKIASAQDILSQYNPSTPETWSDIYENIKQVSPEFAKRFNPAKAPDQKSISAAMQNADLHRRVFEDAARQQTQLEFAQPQMPFYAPGYNQRYDRATNSFYLEAPRQPGAMPLDANAMLTPSAQPQNAFAGQPLTSMTPTAPAAEEPPAPGRIKPTAAPMPPIGTPEYEIRRSARSVLDIAGVDLDKGTNRVADLIRDTPSSAFRAYAQQKTGAFTGKATPQMENVGRLNTIIDNMVLAAANNKLGGQVSDADVRLLKEAQAQINDPSVQPNQRLAAWDEVLRIKAKQAGYSYTPMDLSQLREQPIVGERKPAQMDDAATKAFLTDLFGQKK